MLKLPQNGENDSFFLYVDGSATGFGGVLMEEIVNENGEAKNYVIGYLSKKCTEADSRRSST